MTRIYLDPGHGGHDPGASGNGLREKDVVLDIAWAALDRLTRYRNVTVRMSRDTDIFRSLSWRSADANGWGADLFVSFHANAFSSQARGFETYIHTSRTAGSRAAQDAIHPAVYDELTDRDGAMPDRGRKTANFHVVRETNMPAVLVEYGFVTNEADATLLGDPGVRTDLGVATADAIADLHGLTLAEPDLTPEPDPRRYEMIVYGQRGTPDATSAFAAHQAKPVGVLTSDPREVEAGLARGELVLTVGGPAADEFPNAVRVAGRNALATLQAIADVQEEA